MWHLNQASVLPKLCRVEFFEELIVLSTWHYIPKGMIIILLLAAVRTYGKKHTHTKPSAFRITTLVCAVTTYCCCSHIYIYIYIYIYMLGKVYQDRCGARTGRCSPSAACASTLHNPLCATSTMPATTGSTSFVPFQTGFYSGSCFVSLIRPKFVQS